jgi:hypothetical protein
MIISRRLRWAGIITCVGEERNAKTVLTEKGEVKRTLGRPRFSWEDSVPMNCKEIG